jgi:hypothetical protein
MPINAQDNANPEMGGACPKKSYALHNLSLEKEKFVNVAIFVLK